MNKKIKWIFAVAMTIVIGFFALKSCYDEEEAIAPTFKASIPNTDADDPANIKALDLYIDFSGSMRGYIDFANINDGGTAQTTMLQTVTYFLDNIEANYPIKTVNHCGASVYSKNDFRNAMQNHTVFNGGTTPLHDFINNSCAQANDSSVVALVTDMVLSYGKPKLMEENDNYYNKRNLAGLSSHVYNAMTDLKKRGMDVVILQYYSDFNGTYYYNLTENIVDGEAYKGRLMKDRPFYILLAGKQQALKGILAKECLKEPQNIYASFGIRQEDMKTTSCDIFEDQTQDWTLGSDTTATTGGFWTTADLADSKTKFNVAIEGFRIPAYLNKKNLSGSCEGNLANVSNIVYDEGHKRLTFSAETVPFSKLENNAEIAITIKSTNSWKDSAHIDDDVAKSDSEMQGRTWGLGNVLDEITRAFYGSALYEGEAITTTSFSLVKK